MSDENLASLHTERADPELSDLDCEPTIQILERMNRLDRDAVEAVGRAKDEIADVVDLVATAVRAGGRLIYVGAGTSGRVAEMDAAECPPTFGTSPEQIVAIRTTAEDDERAGRQAVTDAGAGPGDVVVGIAASGRTPFVLGALQQARAAGAVTVGFACNPGSLLAAAGDYAITVDTGPELIAGSTRLKAGTAQKLVLNMLTTVAMIRVGRVYGNQMVAMRLSNEKLADRGAKMVAKIAGCTPTEAAELLQRCGGDIRAAVVARRFGVDPVEAEQRVAAAGGSLRVALEETMS